PRIDICFEGLSILNTEQLEKVFPQFKKFMISMNKKKPKRNTTQWARWTQINENGWKFAVRSFARSMIIEQNISSFDLEKLSRPGRQMFQLVDSLTPDLS